MKKIFSILTITALIFACGSEKENSRKVVARIGNEELTLKMLQDMIPYQQKDAMATENVQNYIQMWIDQELLFQEAQRLGVAKRELKALHILVGTYEEARIARRRIRGGEEFETVAREVSLDYRQHKRIDTGYFSSDDVIPEIANVVFGWKIGSITRPIETQYGFHIFKIIDKRPPETVKSFEEVRDQIVERLKSEKREELYRDFLTQLTSKIEVHTNFEYLKELYRDKVSISRGTMSDSL